MRMSKSLAFADLIATIDGLGNPEVAVIGDLILDHYVMGSVERISPEAPTWERATITKRDSWRISP